VDAELAVVELGAVAEVGAGDQQLLIGHTALHVKHAGTHACQIEGAGIEKAARAGPARIPEVPPGGVHKGLAQLIGQHGAAPWARDIDHHAGFQLRVGLQLLLHAIEQLGDEAAPPEVEGGDQQPLPAALHHLADQHRLIPGDVAGTSLGAGPHQLGLATALVVALLQQQLERELEAGVAAPAPAPLLQPGEQGLPMIGPITSDLVLAEGCLARSSGLRPQTSRQALEFTAGEGQQGLAHGSSAGKKAASATSRVGTTKARSRN